MSDIAAAEKLDWRHGLLGSLTLFPVIALFLLVDPIPQPQAYHDLADSRLIFGIPNFFDVMSNLVFLLVGLSGSGEWSTFLFILNWSACFLAVLA